MEFTIYSIGESVFLEQILMSVAMISGSGSMAKMAAIGGVLGVIIVMVQAIFQGGQRIEFQHVLLGWIVYACLFGPTARILVEDVYSGHVRVVDNVPISVGVAGGMISKIGYGITELFEQGFAAIEPGQNRRRYMESLSVINELHRNGNDSAIFTAVNSVIGPNADLRLSWQNYIRECTLTKIDLGEVGVDTVMRAPIDEALRFDSAIYGTRLHLAAVEDVTCSEAYPKLQAATAHIKDNPDVNNALNRIMGYNQANSNGEQSPMDKAQGAIDSLMLTTANAYDFVKVSILEPVYLEAVTGRYQDVRDYSSALMINQAIAQRNIQWAAEQSMFMTVARPLMAFFEGFIYAVTPVLAFLIMLGGMGLTLAVKYVQSLLWIQLWMPTLAVTNLYINSAASNEMVNKLGYSTDALNSMYALNTTADVLGNWIAVGGMLAAATPIISLFFVTGSTYAFTSLAQRIGGSDHVDEKQTAPDVIKSGPYAQMDPKFTGDQLRGMMGSGAQTLMSGVTMGGNLSTAVSSAQTTQQQTSEAFSNQLSKSWQSAVQQGTSHQAAEALGTALRSSNAESVQGLLSHAKQLQEKNDWSQAKTDAYIGSNAIKMSADLKAGKKGQDSSAGIGGGIGGEAANRETNQNSRSAGSSDALTDSASFSVTDQQGLLDEIARQSTNTSTSSFAHMLGDTDGQNLSRSASELVSANETFAKLDNMQTSGGVTFNTDMRTLGSQVAAHAGASNDLNRLMQTATPEAKQEAARLEQRYRNDPSEGGYGMSAQTARDAARLTALTNPVNYKEGNFAEGYNAAAGVVGQALGRNLGVDSDPMKNANIAGPNVGDVRGEVGGAVTGPERFDSGSARQQAYQGVGGREQVYEHHNRNMPLVHAKAEANAMSVTADSREASINSIIAGGVKPGMAGSQMGSVETSIKNLGELGGTYFGAAVQHAQQNGLAGANAAGKAAQDQVINELYDGHVRMGQDRMHLTPAQSHLYAAYGTYLNNDTVQHAYNEMWKENAANNPGMDETKLSELTHSMARQIRMGAYHGPVAGATHMMDIGHYNMSNEMLTGGSQGQNNPTEGTESRRNLKPAPGLR